MSAFVSSHSVSVHSASTQSGSSQPVAAMALAAPPMPGTKARAQQVFCFSVQAEADPGVMPRVLALFAKRNLVPHRWHSQVTGPRARDLSIDIQVVGLAADRVAYVADCLRQLHYVDSVLTSELQGL